MKGPRLPHYTLLPDTNTYECTNILIVRMNIHAISRLRSDRASDRPTTKCAVVSLSTLFLIHLLCCWFLDFLPCFLLCQPIYFSFSISGPVVVICGKLYHFPEMATFGACFTKKTQILLLISRFGDGTKTEFTIFMKILPCE